jgi:hypothetical protein
MRHPTHFLTLALTAIAFLVTACGATDGEAPTPEIVGKVLRGFWERPASVSTPRSTLELHSVKFGKPYKATLQEVQVDGLPKGGVVTPAIIDFSVRTFYTNETQVLRRAREGKVYKDKFGEWAVMTGSVRGQDQRSAEPAVK